MKDQITAFLVDPLKVGSYSLRVILPYQAVLELREYLSGEAKKHHRRFKVNKLRYDRADIQFMRDIGSPISLDKELDDMMNFFMSLKDKAPNEIKKWGVHGVSVIAPRVFYAIGRWG